MHQLKLRYLTTEDQPQFLEWVNATPNNLFDENVLKYPTLRVICSYNSVPVAYLPTQRTLFLESLAVNPEAPLMDKAQAFRDLVKAAELLASSEQIKEIYMLCQDENVLKIAENHGFERVPYPLVRMRL